MDRIRFRLGFWQLASLGIALCGCELVAQFDRSKLPAASAIASVQPAVDAGASGAAPAGSGGMSGAGHAGTVGYAAAGYGGAGGGVGVPGLDAGLTPALPNPAAVDAAIDAGPVGMSAGGGAPLAPDGGAPLDADGGAF